MSDTQQQPQNPVAFFILGSVTIPAFILLTSYILWLTTRNLNNIFWMATVLTCLLTLITTFQMIASRWEAWRVSLFTATTSVLMGLCLSGVSLLGTHWSLLTGMGLLFVTMLVILFTDLDDYMKLPLIVMGMIAEATVVWIFFSWLGRIA